jgi:hypothetical protein
MKKKVTFLYAALIGVVYVFIIWCINFWLGFASNNKEINSNHLLSESFAGIVRKDKNVDYNEIWTDEVVLRFLNVTSMDTQIDYKILRDMTKIVSIMVSYLKFIIVKRLS